MVLRYVLHDKIEGRIIAAGLMVNFNAPIIADLAALIGFDFFVMDCEHGPIGPEAAENMIRAAQAGGIAPLVRISSLEANEALRFLDLGAGGILFPHVESGADARRAVDAVRFPPAGKRGVAPGTRAAQYGATQSFTDYLDTANRHLLVVPIVETPSGVDAIEEIVQTPGVDVIAIGALDLATAMGFPGNRAAPQVVDAIGRTIQAVRAAGKPVLMAGGTAEQLRQLRKLGADLVMAPFASWLVPLGRSFLHEVRA